MSHPSRRSPLFPVYRLLFAAVLSGWIAGSARAVEEEEIVEEEPVEAPAPESAPAPAAKPAATPAPVDEPAAAPAATPESAKPAVEPNPVTLNPAAEPAGAVEDEAAAPEDAGEGESEEEGMELAEDEPAAAGPVTAPADPEVETPAVAAVPVAEPPAAEESVEEAAVEPDSVVSEAAPAGESGTAGIPVIEPEAPQPMPVWNPRAQEAAFTDFLRAGIPLDSAKGMSFDARVLGATDSFRSTSVQTEQLFITGTHAAGKVFAVYRAAPRTRLARYIGLLATLRSAGTDRTRAQVLRSGDFVAAGDGLVALEDARAEFNAERARAVRDSAKAGESSGRVVCFHEEREIQTQPDDVLLVDRGSRDGITLAWICEMPQEGSDRVAAYGRVVRLSPDACLVRVLKSYEPVRAGVTARLASRPASDRARAGRGR